MNTSTVLKGIIAVTCLSVHACKSPQKKMIRIDTPRTVSSKSQVQSDNKELQFEIKIYLKADAIYSGKVYTNKDKKDVFYRILEIPEEENIMLIAENISIGEEGGNYQLIKRVRLTDDNAVLPRFGLSKIDSVKFIDSVRVEGYFNDKKMIINVDSLKKM
ncbi:hypothetical protein ACPPVU_04830 [Mucilaginibacter sp. McL0603]|uniref:hypothetical protein n=1 Tax=Mucilaginibacter sp. McL0603 TaxID=3415670 RepID=UPI003CF1F917